MIIYELDPRTFLAYYRFVKSKELHDTIPIFRFSSPDITVLSFSDTIYSFYTTLHEDNPIFISNFDRVIQTLNNPFGNTNSIPTPAYDIMRNILERRIQTE